MPLRYVEPARPGEPLAAAMAELAGSADAQALSSPTRGRRRAAASRGRTSRTAPPGRILSSLQPMKIAILGTRGIPASYSGFETAVEQLASRLTARGHEVIVYCRPHVVDRKLTEYKGARAGPPADDPEQVPGHVRAHLPVGDPRGADHPARRGAVLHRRQLAAVPDHPAGVDPGADQRRRARLRPAQVAGAGQGLSALRRAHARRAGPTRRSPTATPSPTSSSAATASGSASCPTASRIPATTAPDDARRGWGSSRASTSCSSAGSSPRTTRTCWWRRSARIDRRRARGMKLAIVGGAPYADDYIRQVCRSADPRVVFPGYVFGTRLLGAPAPRLPVLRADRGRRHPSGDPRGDGGRQLRAGQRPPAERRDGRRCRRLLRGPDGGRPT